MQALHAAPTAWCQLPFARSGEPRSLRHAAFLARTSSSVRARPCRSAAQSVAAEVTQASAGAPARPCRAVTTGNCASRGPHSGMNGVGYSTSR